MRRLLGPILIATTGAAFLGVGVLIAVLGDLDDSTRASADLVELRADAPRIALLAEEALQSGSSDELEGAIGDVEARSSVVPEVAAAALDAKAADPLLGRIRDAWSELAETARLRAQGLATTAELVAASDETRARVNALVDAVAGANESRLSQIAGILRIAIVVGVGLLLFFALLMTGSIRRHFSEYDAGTGLPRERRLRQQLDRRLHASPAGVAVLAISFDKFERARDTLGSEATDQLLAEASATINEALTVRHTLARGAGDGFIVILEGHEAAATRAAGALIQALDRPYSVKGLELRITASVGIALSDVHGDDVESLLHAADAAKARARALGGARFHLHDASDDSTDSSDVLGLEVELRRAIDQDEFVLYFQPQIGIADGRLIGAEALLRWQSPSRGLVSPGLFVPILESTDLIGPVGEWVIRTAAHEAAAWPRSRNGEAMRVAVNVSGHQLVDGRLVEVVSEALANSPLDPSRLEIEVTETAALSQPETATRVLRALRSMGVHSALDDFGTGQSSLEHIKSLPGDSIKIDRTFVVDIVDDTTDRSIVEAVVSIARSLGRTTVAEGVETEEQLELLRELGCDIAQGYLIGRPMPPPEFRTFIRQWRGLVPVEELEVAVA